MIKSCARNLPNLLNSPARISHLCQWESDTVAVHAAGNIYVVDTNNVRVRKILPPGRVVAVAGTGERWCSFDQPDGRVDCGTNFAFGKRREP